MPPSRCRRTLHAVAALLVAAWLVLLGCVAAAAGGTVAVAGTGDDRVWRWPLEPVSHVVRAFERPSSPYGPGHRGVDLAGYVGQPVLAAAAGVVTYAGPLGGRGVVVVDHGRLRSTYQPVTALVASGDSVTAGQPIGFLQQPYSHCAPAACLHLGARRGEVYLDPLMLLGARPIRLKPLTDLPGDAPPTGGLIADPGRGGYQPRRTGGGAVGARLGVLAGRQAATASGAGMSLGVGGA